MDVHSLGIWFVGLADSYKQELHDSAESLAAQIGEELIIVTVTLHNHAAGTEGDLDRKTLTKMCTTPDFVGRIARLRTLRAEGVAIANRMAKFMHGQPEHSRELLMEWFQPTSEEAAE
jgi:hypothetical protein